MKQHKMVIRPDGKMVCIYIDAIRPLVEQAKVASCTRVSHVEPNEQGLWVAAIIDGPVSPPFRLREEALAWEVEWVNANVVK